MFRKRMPASYATPVYTSESPLGAFTWKNGTEKGEVALGCWVAPRFQHTAPRETQLELETLLAPDKLKFGIYKRVAHMYTLLVMVFNSSFVRYW